MRGALRGLEIVEERSLAGRLAGILYLTAAATIVLLPLLPGGGTSHWPVVLGAAGLGTVWGALCLTLVPWERAHPLVSHVSTFLGLPLTAVAMAATGGADSPAKYYLLFIVVFASSFYPLREAVPYLIGCILVHALPLVYEPGAVREGLLGELLIVAPTYLVLGGLIISGKRLIVSLRERARRLSLLDPLTELPNRRALLEAMEERVGGERASDALGLLLVDIDRFKDANTLFGHPGGDRVLCETGNALRHVVRAEEDIAARLGGDEFAIVARGATEEGMRRLADRVLDRIREVDGELDLLGFRLSVSIGWARSPGDAETVDELLAAADLCMRVAKVTGRGRSQSPRDLQPENLG